MADSRKDYTVSVNGVPHHMRLSEDRAKKLYGDNAKPGKPTPAAKQANAPANKAAAKPANKAS